MSMKVVMIGTGYVGLVSGACFAEFGWNVTCIDKDEERIARLERGEVPIFEPGLEDMVSRNVRFGRLSFSSQYAPHVQEADVVFIAVGTPSRRGDGYADLSYVYSAAEEIGRNLSGYTVIVDKSTVPVGTARNVKRIIARMNPDSEFDVASNPEFLREGSALGDFMRPDRVVIGVESERAAEMLRELYRPLYLLETPMIVTDPESAELIKYASNAFLALKISFINEVANLCEDVGANVRDVSRAMGLDKRIGPKFLHAGPGFGGSCFPKDVSALKKIFHDHSISGRIVEAVEQVNNSQKSLMVKKIRDAVGGNEYGKKIAVLGLTFKPQTDDMRESPALTIIPALQNGGAEVSAADPQGIGEAERLLPGCSLCRDPYEACDGADAVVILTEWNEYRALDLPRLRACMRGTAFLDLRNIYDGERVADAGFVYSCVGRKPSAASR